MIARLRFVFRLLFMSVPMLCTLLLGLAANHLMLIGLEERCARAWSQDFEWVFGKPPEDAR